MTVAEAASYWFVRHDAADMSTDELRCFEAWRAEKSAHREAFERTQIALSGFEGGADAAELRALRIAALAVGPTPSHWPRSIGAVVALMGVVWLMLYATNRLQKGDSLPIASAAVVPERYVTARNERSTVTLSDGTVVTLNLDTSLIVSITATDRLVRIIRGQAFFEVSRDVSRPFVVAAADRRISALGTQFDVRLEPDRVEVILLEGRVGVDHAAPSMLERLKLRASHVELLPGQRLVAAMGVPVAVTNTNAQRATSWRQGWVVFDDETVGAAVAELNRYSDRTIIVPDESVRRLRLSGVFRVGQPDRFVAIIQELLPVKAVAGSQGEVLLIHAEPHEDGR